MKSSAIMSAVPSRVCAFTYVASAAMAARASSAAPLKSFSDVLAAARLQ